MGGPAPQSGAHLGPAPGSLALRPRGPGRPLTGVMEDPAPGKEGAAAVRCRPRLHVIRQRELPVIPAQPQPELSSCSLSRLRPALPPRPIQ